MLTRALDQAIPARHTFIHHQVAEVIPTRHPVEFMGIQAQVQDTHIPHRVHIITRLQAAVIAILHHQLPILILLLAVLTELQIMEPQHTAHLLMEHPPTTLPLTELQAMARQAMVLRQNPPPLPLWEYQHPEIYSKSSGKILLPNFLANNS